MAEKFEKYFVAPQSDKHRYPPSSRLVFFKFPPPRSANRIIRGTLKIWSTGQRTTFSINSTDHLTLRMNIVQKKGSLNFTNVKFSPDQKVFWGTKVCQIIATKEKPYITDFPENAVLPPGINRTIEVPENHDYVIGEFRRINELKFRGSGKSPVEPQMVSGKGNGV